MQYVPAISAYRVDPADSYKLVRKESEASQVDFELELENLAMLKYLKHPNIIELLGSYTHDSKYNLIFPKASCGDLAELLKKPRSRQFASNDSFLIALGELSSAVSAVHNFASDDRELAKSGCHHDIKPKNILVNGTRFILADFGLSRFKNPEKTSETIFKVGEGYYVAPECEDIDGLFLRHKIRRSSDIWSFGCIIAEVLTYMMKGAEGVEEFMQKRRFKVGPWKFSYFHSGDRPNSGVTDWLTHLEHEASCSSATIDPRSCKMLLQLVKRMLAMAPEDRPKAFQVEAALYFIALDTLARDVAELYCNASTSIHSKSIEAFIEEKMFESWRWVLGMIDTNVSETIPRQIEAKFSGSSFTHIVKWLGEIKIALENILSTKQPPQSRVYLPLRHLNLNLLNQLPQHLQEQANRYLQLQVLESANEAHLEDVENSLKHISSYEKLGILAAIKRMTILTKDNPTLSQPQLDPKPTLDVNIPGEKVIGRIVEASTRKEQRVLVEWKHYEGHWEKHGPELLDRISGIAQLLGSGRVSDNLRILRCVGFYHAPDLYALGLVFEFPPSKSRLQLFTLRKLFDSNQTARRSDNEKPMLGSKFLLAHQLAASVLEVHKVGWLHKNISSSNIAFFAPNQSAVFKCLEKPYIVDFVHSRPNETNIFSEGPQRDAEDYQHPEYLSDPAKRFRPEFDYYSVGMVLLELGMWKSIKEMTDGRDWNGISRQVFREKLLSRRVPQLGPTMGVRYRDAVKHCLQWSPDGDKTAASRSTFLHFHESVVDQLAQCIV